MDINVYFLSFYRIVQKKTRKFYNHQRIKLLNRFNKNIYKFNLRNLYKIAKISKNKENILKNNIKSDTLKK